MKQLFRHLDNCYLIHTSMPIHYFTNKNGEIDMEWVKMWRDHIHNVDHVLKTDTHFLFTETIQDAEIIEEVVEETHL